MSLTSPVLSALKPAAGAGAAAVLAKAASSTSDFAALLDNGGASDPTPSAPAMAQGSLQPAAKAQATSPGTLAATKTGAGSTSPVAGAGGAAAILLPTSGLARKGQAADDADSPSLAVSADAQTRSPAPPTQAGATAAQASGAASSRPAPSASSPRSSAAASSRPPSRSAGKGDGPATGASQAAAALAASLPTLASPQAALPKTSAAGGGLAAASATTMASVASDLAQASAPDNTFPQIATAPTDAKDAAPGSAASDGSAPIQPGPGGSRPSQAQAAASKRTVAAAATPPGAAKSLLGLAVDAGAKLLKAEAAPTGHGRADTAAPASMPAASSPVVVAGLAASDNALSPPDGAALHAEAGLEKMLADPPVSGESSGGGASADDPGRGDDTPSAGAGFGLGLPAPASPATAAGSAAASAPAPAATVSTAAADLAAQMAAKAAASGSRFTLQLNPHGLGRVDVTVAIGADRQLTAALAFADPHAANAMSAHAGELKTALEQAGFTVPHGGFDFTSSPASSNQPALPTQAGGFGLGGGGLGDPGGGFAGSGGRSPGFAFGEADPLSAGEAAAYTAGGDSRLDIRI